MDLVEVGLDDEFSLDDEFGDEIGEELDDSWLKNYSIKEEIFNKFYKDTVKHIKLYFFYIDSKREIIKVLKQKKDQMQSIHYFGPQTKHQIQSTHYFLGEWLGGLVFRPLA